MGFKEARTRTAEETAELMAKARVWQGTQGEFARAHGVAQSTVSKWRSAAPPTALTSTADRRSEAVQRYGAGEGAPRPIADAMGISVRSARVPTMLEVVPVATAPRPVLTAPCLPVGARLSLPGGAELRFDTLPSARWVAEFVAELSRC